MPRVSIMTSEASTYNKAPHARKNGPWEEWELEDAGRHLEHAEQIKANGKLMDAIVKHHAKKAEHHRRLAEEMKPHMKRGLVSKRALDKVSEREHD
jgi:hypothetical protein